MSFIDFKEKTTPMYQKHLNAEENGDLQSATLEVEKFVEVLIVGPLTKRLFLKWLISA